ncbi:ABC transporter permease [Roseivirga sp.]|uniref:ABC transporter permease n=1 Tax=Roseivirga sp. TaxID=1964215 RepID=UPI003B5167C9
MLKNYFKVALRNLLKHKGFSFINIVGLSVGLTCCLLIGLYINEEMSYDKFHENADETYRFTREFMSQDGSTSLHLSRLAPPFAHYLRDYYEGDIDKIGRFITTSGTVEYGEKLFNESDLAFADPEIVDILTFETIEGNLKDALQKPGSVVISKSLAEKYFGNEDPMGKTIRVFDQVDLLVQGVYSDWPENSSFELNMMADFSAMEQFYGGRENLLQAWGSNNFTTLFTLTETGSIDGILGRMEEFLKIQLGETAPTWTRLHVQKLTDIHLHSSLSDELGENSDITYVYIFTSIAVLILLIACINYMNLATARSTRRAKEVGMRKVFGAGKTSLINQFLIESMVLTLFAVVLSIGATSVILPFFRQFTDLQLNFNVVDNFGLLAIIFGSALLVGVLAGSYPAFYLSAFRPLEVMRGSKGSAPGKSGLLRKILVVAQFSISVVLIISTVVVVQQLNFMQNKNLGYDKDQMMILNVSQEVAANFQTFKNELTNISGVKSVGGSSRIPSGQLLDSQGAQAEVDGQMQPTQVVIKQLQIDPDFIPNYQMEVIAGRNFSDDWSRDSANFILNEKSVEIIGWEGPEDAIGKRMNYGGVVGRVIGVVKDFHFESLQSEIVPVIMENNRNRMQYLSIKIEGQNLRSSVSEIEQKYAEFSPNSPIRYNFLNERFDNLYQSESQRSELFTIFSGLAIFLACLGLFGLASFTVAQRGKEISIRKVLGASVNQIVSTLSKEFVILVGIAMLLAAPVGWYFMSDWLGGYAYRISLGALPFVIAGGVALSIAFITISMQTFKAAFSNPATRLRED